MTTKIRNINESNFYDYKKVIVEDEDSVEYAMNFPKTATEKDIRDTWEREESWRFI